MSKEKSCMNTYQYLVKKWKEKRIPIVKQPVMDSAAMPPAPENITVATIAVVLDGEVQEVIRAQDRLAALFLSEPTFIEVPETLETVPTIGWAYKNGEFTPPSE